MVVQRSELHTTVRCMHMTSRLMIVMLVLLMTLTFLSCAKNWTTARFELESSRHSDDDAQFLFLLEETLTENNISVMQRLRDDSSRYVLEIKYIHPPGTPTASIHRSASTGYEVIGNLSVTPHSLWSGVGPVEIEIKWRSPTLGTEEVEQAVRESVVSEFLEKLKSE